MPSRALEHFAALPGGRVLATGFFNQQADRRAFVSDDGGETWRETARLPEPREGIPGDAWLAVIGEQSALAVGGRGIVYRTDDAGETWAIAGRTPVTASNMTSRMLMVGPEGRLYVGLLLAGTERAWAVRTVQPVVAVSSVPNPEASGARLRVSPNPGAGAVRIALRLDTPEAARLTVFDARGRAVHTEASGARGQHAWEVDTSAWAAGVYVARAEVGGEVVTAQLTVAR